MGFSATTDRSSRRAATVAFEGKLDLTVAAPLRKLLFDLIGDGAHWITVDLTQATSVDSTAAGILIIADNTLRRTGGGLRVEGARIGMPIERLLDGEVMNMDTTTGDEVDGHKPRLVFFHSRASGRARRIDGYVANVLQRRQNHETFRLQRVLVEDHPDLAARFGVDGIPTLFVIVDNRVQAKIENPRGTQDIEAELAPWLRPGRSG